MQLKISIEINGKDWFSISQHLNLTLQEVLYHLHSFIHTLLTCQDLRSKTNYVNGLFKNSRRRITEQ